MSNANSRIQVLANQLLAKNPETKSLLTRQDCAAGDSSSYARRLPMSDDIVIVAAVRTPLTKAKRGGLKDADAVDLSYTVFKGVLDRTKVDPKRIGDVVMGSVMGPSSQRANEVRIAALCAGIPDTVPVRTVNRQCSSGLQAIADVAASIRAGFYDIGLAGGVETMSHNPMNWEGGINPRISECSSAQSCMLPMGITSENVAKKFGVSRETQDKFALLSHQKAAAAQAAGRFKDEIIPVSYVAGGNRTIPGQQTKGTKKTEDPPRSVTIFEDDGIRGDVTLSVLSSLKPAFKSGGSTTAGNSSQVTDGASACLLMTRATAVNLGLPILGTFRSFSVVGVDPAIMGVGPAVAIPAAVERAGLTINDIDVFEINEAFASQATFCVNKLGIDPEKVNPNGGAIALGHPLGATGSRCLATLLYEMKRRGKGCRFGVVSMCIGSGMGAAAVFEAEGIY
mmetsp:Transcript_34140/g.61558  ORF Transcript_34140/g.61558 Transcript_34140/m.61558 type:complete len:453 (-) Transcript_34140:453-1811(-)